MDFALINRLRNLPGPILITGHTGFKGAWLSMYLNHLDIRTIGFSLEPEIDSLFTRAGLMGSQAEEFGDIRDFPKLHFYLNKMQPSLIIHMAAQPLVVDSYKNPLETFEINVMGTANVLAAALEVDSVQAIAVVTTDKVYRNNNKQIKFKESDPLGGNDPYSASKVGTEAVVDAWSQIAANKNGPPIFSLRAGNVIGGGDYSANRLLPDIVRAKMNNEMLTLRNPRSTRPWQHVLDALTGYLMACDYALTNKTNQHFNFGPPGESLSVLEVTNIARENWLNTMQISVNNSSELYEAKTLELDSTLAKSILGWSSQFTQTEAVISTVEWWRRAVDQGENPKLICEEEIDTYLGLIQID